MSHVGEKWAAIQFIHENMWTDEPIREMILLESQVSIEERAELEGVTLDPETWEVIEEATITTGDGETIKLSDDPEWGPPGVLLRVEGIGI